MGYRLKTRGSRHFGPMAKKRMALEKQIAFEIEDAHSVLQKGIWAQVRFLWLNRTGWHSFGRGLYLLLRMWVRG